VFRTAGGELMLLLAGMLLAAGNVVSAKPEAFVYCTAPSTSPRAQGLIVTSIFRSRSETEFIESAFANYLRSSYAPYGNGWIFPPSGVECRVFRDRRKAEVRRAYDISLVPQPVQTVFTVSFQLG
jgi:hypothetical protein